MIPNIKYTRLYLVLASASITDRSSSSWWITFAVYALATVNPLCTYAVVCIPVCNTKPSVLESPTNTASEKSFDLSSLFKSMFFTDPVVVSSPRPVSNVSFTLPVPELSVVLVSVVLTSVVTGSCVDPSTIGLSFAICMNRILMQNANRSIAAAVTRINICCLLLLLFLFCCIKNIFLLFCNLTLFPFWRIIRSSLSISKVFLTLFSII